MILGKNFGLIPETRNYCKKNTSHMCHVNSGARKGKYPHGGYKRFFGAVFRFF